MSQTLVRWQDLHAVPWKNGGGVTRRVAGAPGGATGETGATGATGAGSGEIDWSVSIAEIEADGPFSAFPGIDRVLMLIGGSELILDVAGTGHVLRVPDTLAFSGDAATSCRVPAGPARALNLMTRRGRATGTSRAVDVTGSHTVPVAGGETVLLVALTDGLVTDGGVALGVLDTVLGDAAGAVTVTGTGLLAELRIRGKHPE